MQDTFTEGGFYGLGIAPALLQSIAKLQFSVPTPIQSKTIPAGIEGKDLIGIAQTGSGKTLAFGIPMIQRILQEGAQDSKGLVLVPTRELALQIAEVFSDIGASLGFRAAVLIGGAPMGPQISALRRNPHAIIATPGRLNDHLEQRTLSLGKVKILVLDEADHMLDMGFLPQIKRILAVLPKEKQTMLFSATLPQDIMQIALSTMKLPLRIEVAPPGTTVDSISQEVFIVRKESKAALLEKILSEHRGSTLVFTRMKYGAKRVAHHLRSLGHTAAEIHSNRSLNQRKEALLGFKTGKYRVLVATDIAARGIDVSGIELVINFDLPMTSSGYVHRIGRTGRAGLEGKAISFALPEEQRDIRDIERLIKKTLRISKLPSDLPVPHIPPPNTERSLRTPPSRHFGARGSSRGGRHQGRGRYFR